MTNWKILFDVNPEPSLLDAIAFSEGKLNVYINDGDGFVAYLRTLPDADAVSIAKQAVRGGYREHNTRELFRSRSVIDWLIEMQERGLFPLPEKEQDK